MACEFIISRPTTDRSLILRLMWELGCPFAPDAAGALNTWGVLCAEKRFCCCCSGYAPVVLDVKRERSEVIRLLFTLGCC